MENFLYGHALNIVVKDACFKVKCFRWTFEAVRGMKLLVTKSPIRNTKLEEIRNQSKNGAKSIHTFCPTHWTVRGETLKCVLKMLCYFILCVFYFDLARR